MDIDSEQRTAAQRGAPIDSREKLTLLHQAALLLLGQDSDDQGSDEGRLEALAELTAAAFLFPNLTVARIRIGERQFGGRCFPKDVPVLAAGFKGAGGAKGVVEAALLPTEGSAADFLSEEKALLQRLAGLLESFFERGEADRRFEHALREMADTVAVHAGQAHHEALVKYLSSHFGLGVALVGVLDDARETITSLAIAEDGVLLPDITYALAGTPCDDVVKNNACFHGEHVQALFPDDVWLQQAGAEGYAGVRLHDTSGKVIGVISAISRQPLRDIAGVESFFKLAAARASTELDRTEKVAEIQASELRYRLAESGTTDGLWDIDLEANTLYSSPRVAELLGLQPEELGHSPDEFWARMHPDDLAPARAARREHLVNNLPLDFQCRIRHASGNYRWFRVRAQALRDSTGRALRLTGGLTDITEGKRHQAQLTAENAWLATFARSPSLEALLDVIAATAQELFDGVPLNILLLDAAAEPRVFPVSATSCFDIAQVRRLLISPREAGTMDRTDMLWPRSDGDAFERIEFAPVTVENVAQRVGIVISHSAGLHVQPHERQFVAAAMHLVQLALNHVRKETDLERQRLLFENLFECAPEAMVILDRNDCVLNANPRFTEVFQYTVSEIRGRALNELVVPPEFAHEARTLSRRAMGGKTAARDSFRRRKDGKLVPVSILGAPVTVSGTEASYFAVYRDQSSLHEATQRLDHQARHDQLTGLPNRYEFERRLRQAMSLSARGRGYTGVLYFDLDQFKVINDTVGHARGDDVLLEVTRRLRPLLPSPHFLARLGGDEFAVLVVNGRLRECESLAQQIRENFVQQPFQVDDRMFPLTASFGIVVVEAGARQDPHEVLSLADSACFLAKERGRNRIQVYDPADMGVAQRREEMDWISRINEALVENRFQLFYQRIAPVHDGDGREHFEILLRMLDAEGNRIPPGVFIPPAERYNLMPRIDRWVLETVFERLGKRGRDAQENLLVAVNISGSTLSDESLPEFVVDLFERYTVLPQSLCFEITETAAIANFEDALQFIAVLRMLGCKVALDDFGSGLSSFRYLKEIVPDYLKIDGSFVREIGRSSTDYSMVEAINRVGKSIGIHTIAEFVEDEAILDVLREIGVDFAQGYGLHRPEPWLF